MTKHATEAERIREAYLRMVTEANYRPGAPSDGWGTILLNPGELSNPDRLEREAQKYAADFMQQEDTLHFPIGISNWETNRALVYVIEAARLLCGVADGLAVKLLRLAIAEIESTRQFDAKEEKWKHPSSKSLENLSR